jgi:PAS domain S-box-containing protein
MEKTRSRKVYDLNNMLGLDLFLAAADAQALQKIGPYLKAAPGGKHPLLSADVIRFATESTQRNRLKNTDLETLSAWQQEHGWQIDLKQLLQREYDALVLTTRERVIEWVNDGFGEMTGYSRAFITGKTAKVLQGERTDPEIRRHIGQQLQQAIPFTETLVNYRRNREAYDCEICITPLFNQQRLLTHFLALETEIKWISSTANQTIPPGTHI